MRRTLSTLAVLMATALPLAACSASGTADDKPSPSAATTSPTESPSETTSKPKPSTPAGTTIDITIKDGTVDPNGERVKAELGEPITLKIDADTDGELHVHSTPEQEIEFPKGRSTMKLTIDKPGIVDVEDHELEQVIVQLQVS